MWPTRSPSCLATTIAPTSSSARAAAVPSQSGSRERPRSSSSSSSTEASSSGCSSRRVSRSRSAAPTPIVALDWHLGFHQVRRTRSAEPTFFALHDGQVVVEDLDSWNGTVARSVDGRREQRLGPGVRHVMERRETIVFRRASPLSCRAGRCRSTWAVAEAAALSAPRSAIKQHTSPQDHDSATGPDTCLVLRLAPLAKRRLGWGGIARRPR